MYLKSLEMQGFKSFPDKTKLLFDNGTEVGLVEGEAGQGVTVIVGPNGSGKSNIADAMRWVLGEISSKSLRGSKMEDVIFGGADSRRPMGYAEVSVTFDNRGEFAKLDCPYDDVTVTRRYYRAGESEYFINRKAVRLKDIYELFMNTGIGRDGYSIIGQGKIAEMVSRKSEERRSVFEDASGIAKYRHKKDEAERKLQTTEENMARVTDIFEEVEHQVAPLEKAAEKAKKAIELMEEKKKVDVSLWLYDTEHLRGELDEAEEKMNHASFDLQSAEDSIASLEAQNDKLFEISQNSKMESESLLRQIQEQMETNHRLENRYGLDEGSITHTEELIANTNWQIEKQNRLLQEEEKAVSSHEDEIQRLRNEGEELLKEQDAVKAEQEILLQKERKLEEEVATALSDIRSLEQESVDILVRISVLENSKNTDSDKNDSAAEEMEGYEKISKDLGEKAGVKERAVENYDREISGIDAEIAEAEQKVESLTDTLQALTNECNQATFQRDSVAHRIATIKAMDENFEGYSGAVRFVMNKYAEGGITDVNGKPCDKIYGPLSKIISVEEKFLTAIEIALGANLQNIVVENESTAKSAMYALKKAEAGRATFFPLTSMKPATPSKEMGDAARFAGYLGVADTLVNYESKFTNVISSLLGKTVVFDDVDHATAMAKSTGYKVRAVTLDGQLINVGGSFTGGSVKTGNGILSRTSEIKRLEGELEIAGKQAADFEKKIADLQEELEEATERKASAEDRKELIGVLRSTENTQLEQIKGKLEANNTLLQKLKEDMARLEESKAKNEEELASLAKENEELQHRISEMQAFRSEKDALRGETILAREELGRKDTELIIQINRIEQSVETESTLKADAESRCEGIENDIEELKQKIESQKALIEQKKTDMKNSLEEISSGSKLLSELNERRNSLEAGNMEFERKLNELNEKLKEKHAEKDRVYREYTLCDNRLAKLREDQDKLAGRLWEDYEMTRSEAVALGYPPLTKEERPDMITRQNECKNKIRALGPVDLDAVSKYEEVKTRYETMRDQIADMEAAKKELTSVIAQLEVEMKTAFVDSFNQINENFGKTFAELFGGGSAELSLTDPENVLESGIEIKAAPPGKIIKNLMQLSGGEQAFIGVALFFAILQVNPTPFCILDEIEAALDEVNVERLAQYIKRYSHGTQFIMITHRRGTMAAADRLYGVTMPEHGISKVLMLNINDISKKEGEDWDGIFG